MKHIDRIFEIEQICFDEPWSYAMFEAALSNPNSICVLEDYGYALGMQLFDECELHSIAVLPEHRGQGKAYVLMRKFLEKANSVYGGSPVFLEVASRNVHAIKLYQKCGFVEIARRKNYYKSSTLLTESELRTAEQPFELHYKYDDAILMCKHIERKERKDEQNQ